MKIAKACKEENVPRLIHLVPILAQLDSKSKCLRTKAIGEEMLRQEYPRSIIVKSSNVFGNEDRFLNNIGCRNCFIFPLLMISFYFHFFFDLF